MLSDIIDKVLQFFNLKKVHFRNVRLHRKMKHLLRPKEEMWPKF